MKKRTFATQFVAVLLAFVMMVGCTAGQITTTLEAVVDAATIAVPLAGAAAGLSPEVSATISAYLHSVNGAISQTAAELSSTDSNAIKAVRITGYFTAAGLQLGPNLPAGTPTRVVLILDAVAKQVANFLVQFSSHQGTLAGASKTKIQVDKKALDRILAKNQKCALMLKQ